MHTLLRKRNRPASFGAKKEIFMLKRKKKIIKAFFRDISTFTYYILYIYCSTFSLCDSQHSNIVKNFKTISHRV